MSLFVPPVVRATDANNAVLPGAKWYFYASGGTTPAAIYTTSALNVAHTNPVVADSAGLFAPIYLDPAVSYRATLKTAAGVTVQDVDPYNSLSTDLHGILTVDMGTSAVPAIWAKTSLATAWPGLLIENTIHSAVSQVNMFLKRWTADGRPLVWQMAVDVDNNGGFEGICNLEAIDILGAGVIASPISMSRAGEVSINNGVPVAGVALAVNGKVRSFNVGGAGMGRYSFGDGSSYLLGDTGTGAIGIYIGNAAIANVTATGFFPQTNNAFDIGSSSFRWKNYWGAALDLTGNANVAGVYKVSGTQVVGARQTGVPADATDLATALTLLNWLKAKLMLHGLVAA